MFLKVVPDNQAAVQRLGQDTFVVGAATSLCGTFHGATVRVATILSLNSEKPDNRHRDRSQVNLGG